MKGIMEALARRPAHVLAAAVVIYLLLGVGQDGINLDSTTYSVIARNMVEQGRWFDPTYTAYYHTHFAEHPPLVMWVQAVTFALFGASDTTARFFGALCTLGAVLAAYGLGKEIKGKTYGFLSGLLLLLTYNFIQIGNSTLLDVPMSFFVLAALWGLVKAEKQPHRTKPYAITGLALGLAFLTKGVVSGPVWLAVAVVVLWRHRSWLTTARFWLIPALGLGLVLLHILLDQMYADGHFTRHYFMTQVWARFVGGGPSIHTDWWEFTWRFVRMFVPWVVLLPFGVVYMFRRGMNLLFATVITLLLYFVLYSTAAKLYYHYFCPAYALAAPLAALPLALWLRESVVKKIPFWFSVVWLAAAIGVTATQVRIHEIRSPELYSIREPMLRLLDGRPSREGLFIRTGEPDWDYVAKTAWYWRSDIRLVGDDVAAASLLHAGRRYAYILAESNNRLSEARLRLLRLKLHQENEKVAIYIPDTES